MSECKHNSLETKWASVYTGYSMQRCVDCKKILCTYKSLDGSEYNVSSAIDEREQLRAELDAVRKHRDELSRLGNLLNDDLLEATGLLRRALKVVKIDTSLFDDIHIFVFDDVDTSEEWDELS